MYTLVKITETTLNKQKSHISPILVSYNVQHTLHPPGDDVLYRCLYILI
jgi:hypothetical protein